MVTLRTSESMADDAAGDEADEEGRVESVGAGNASGCRGDWDWCRRQWQC